MIRSCRGGKLTGGAMGRRSGQRCTLFSWQVAFCIILQRRRRSQTLGACVIACRRRPTTCRAPYRIASPTIADSRTGQQRAAPATARHQSTLSTLLYLRWLTNIHVPSRSVYDARAAAGHRPSPPLRASASPRPHGRRRSSSSDARRVVRPPPALCARVRVDCARGEKVDPAAHRRSRQLAPRAPTDPAAAGVSSYPTLILRPAKNLGE